MLVCLDCYELFDKERVKFDYYDDWNYCPKLNCSGDLVEIDELFVPVIIELNKKGYITEFCCSGHIHEGHCGLVQSYIKFYGYEIINDYIKENIDKLKDYNLEYNDKDNSVSIRRRFDDKKSMNELLIDICDNAKQITKWAKKLPKLEY